MSDIEDLKEFNAAGSKGNNLNKQPSPPVRRVRRGEDSTASEVMAKDPTVALTMNQQMWAQYGERSFSACERAVDKLPPGQYTIAQSEQLGIYFSKTDINLDELIHLPDSVSETVINEIKAFWQKEEHFRKFGFLWKRGALLWGPPGSGKTSTLQQISSAIIDVGGISIYVDHPGVAAKGLKLLRQVEKKRPLVIMLEDIDAIIEQYGEADLLALMDGELQIDNVVFVATTNYPEKLDARFKNRPSRFDIVKKIGMPNPAARKLYLTSKVTRLIGTDELEQWVSLTDKFSIAHIKELIVSVEVFEVPLREAVERLKTMMEYSPKSEDGLDRRSVGFN